MNEPNEWPSDQGALAQALERNEVVLQAATDTIRAVGGVTRAHEYDIQHLTMRAEGQARQIRALHERIGRAEARADVALGLAALALITLAVIVGGVLARLGRRPASGAQT